ncbi:MAG: glycosyltransferase family 39 protein [Candidatus Omnitrophica bacterium]|nr:hypothetical protein [bacterium]NUN95652.1 glycosyltransferase family 39 protein [Candidatus Omnitrophota bacterium]
MISPACACSRIDPIYISLLLLALALRLGAWSLSEGNLSGDEGQYLGIAHEIRTEGRFALHGETTAWRPPLYPAFLALCGSLTESLALPRLIQVLASLAVLELVALSVAFLTRDRRVAHGALFLGALSPCWIGYPTELLSETLFGFLLLAALVALITGLEKRGRDTWAWHAISGVLLGAATLTRSVTLLLPLAWLLAAPFAERRRDFLKAILIMALAWILTLAPWTLRNALRFHAFIPVNTMSGVVLWQGMNPPAEGFGFCDWEAIDRSAGTRNEVARDRILTRKGMEQMAADPANSARLAAIKLLWLFNPWDGDSHALGSPFNPHTFALLAFACLFLIRWRKPGRDLGRPGAEAPEGTHEIRREALILFGATFVYFVLLAMVYYGSPRFRTPIDPILWMAAGAGLARLRDLPRGVREPLCVGLCLILGALYFGGEEIKNHMKAALDRTLDYSSLFSG